LDEEDSAMAKNKVGAFLVVASVGLLCPVVFADEVVHFTNGSEMAVRSHTVEQNMVKLDLGNNSFIAFPMAMVDKIANAGRDVFLNPTFHPSNQAVASLAVGADTSIHGTGAPVGFVPQANAKGGNGVMLGEAADALPQEVQPNSGMPPTDVSRRRIFNPAATVPAGSQPQVIVPPSARMPGRMTLVAPRVSQPPPNPGAPPPAPGDVITPPPGGSSDQNPGGNN
jgi:hypothetical protein